MIRVVLPSHLRVLAQVGSEVAVPVVGPVTLRTVLDAVEDQYPMLRGTLRDHVTRKRRPFVRFYGEQRDLSLTSPDDPLPVGISTGDEPLLVVGAMAGG